MNRRELVRHGSIFASAAILPSIGWATTRDHSPWRRLFDGRSPDDWTFFQEGVGDKDINHAVAIDKDTLHFLPPNYRGETAPPGYIATKEEFSDFHLKLEYRWGLNRWAPRKLQARNSGVLYHMGPARDGKLFPECIEFQMQERNAGDAILIDALALQGPSLGGTPLWPNWIPALARTYQEPVQSGGYARQWLRRHSDFERLEDWNTLELIAYDDQAAQLVNGRIVNTLFGITRTGTDGTTIPLTRGRIALEFEWAAVEFRNVLIRDLSPESIATIKRQGSD